MGKAGCNGIIQTGNALPSPTGRKKKQPQGGTYREDAGEGVQQVSEENIKRFFETIARIISEREQVKVTVQVSRKEAA